MTADDNQGRKPEGIDRRRLVLDLLGIALFFAVPVAALDDGRSHWSSVPWWACLVGHALLVAGMALLTWVQAVNKFFEPTGRIQADRGQTVIDAGPYAVVRHPGYCSRFPCRRASP